MQLLVLLPALLSLLPRVAAHGYLGGITIDGQEYKGLQTSNGKESAIRQVDAQQYPVKNATNVNLPCGPSATNAKLQATAKPGSRVSVSWVGLDGGKWPHDTGPVIHYMAECTGSDDCTSFDSANAQWFKIDQLGKESATAWFQADFETGQSLSFTIPENTKAGSYLLRSEIIALHLASDFGGAEFYPACAQLKVTGDGTDVPESTVSFPGAYNDNDPGIYGPDSIFYNPGMSYTFPGPPVSNLASKSDSSDSTSDGDNAPKTSSTSEFLLAETTMEVRMKKRSVSMSPCIVAVVGTRVPTSDLIHALFLQPYVPSTATLYLCTC
ncbi:glycosyl hydrolase family 61-domain-containing protein [Amylostereum chailletii]|nr:glycosyl hydrolase family 61-domain-containing protein [Amylostereum chailletii]